MLHKKDRGKILFFRESSFKVAELIFNNPNSTFHIRGIVKEVGLSTTAIVRAVDDLHKFGIIEVEKTDITTNIKADLESEAYRFYKKVFNLYRLERYNIIKALVNEFSAKTVVLFGSYAKGEDVEGSDVDILILSNQKEKLNKSKFGRTEKALNRKINLHVLPSLDKSSSEFKNTVANGIVLHGYLKVV